MAQGGWGHASRLSVWWLAGSPERVGAEGSSAITVRKLPKRWTAFARPSVVVLALALSLAFWLRRRRLVPADTLGLLALILLFRCLLDPMNNDYYHVPFMLLIVAWEGVRVKGLPILSLFAAAALWATMHAAPLSPDALGEQFYLVNNIFYLACMVPLAAWLAWVLFGPRPEAWPSRPRARGASGLTRAWIREPQSSLH
jgi:hypothetical protein